jgi:hypothetical protein
MNKHLKTRILFLLITLFGASMTYAMKPNAKYKENNDKGSMAVIEAAHGKEPQKRPVGGLKALLGEKSESPYFTPINWIEPLHLITPPVDVKEQEADAEVERSLGTKSPSTDARPRTAASPISCTTVNSCDGKLNPSNDSQLPTEMSSVSGTEAGPSNGTVSSKEDVLSWDPYMEWYVQNVGQHIYPWYEMWAKGLFECLEDDSRVYNFNADKLKDKLADLEEDQKELLRFNYLHQLQDDTSKEYLAQGLDTAMFLARKYYAKEISKKIASEGLEQKINDQGSDGLRQWAQWRLDHFRRWLTALKQQ